MTTDRQAPAVSTVRSVPLGGMCLSLAVALVPAACADDAPEAEPSTVVISDGGGGPALDDPSAADAARLAGPNFGFLVDGVGVGDELTDLIDPPPDGDRRPPGGHELVAAHLSFAPTDLPSGGPDEAVAADVVIGDERVPLDHDLRSSLTVVAVAPADEPVRLVVEDEGRTQSIDLRTGEPGDDAVAGFVTAPVDHLRGGYVGSGMQVGPALVPEVPVSVRLDLGVARRMPWVPIEGYAAEGRAWLIVEVEAVTVEGPPPLGPLQGGLATEGTLTVVDESGAEHPAAPGVLEPVDAALDGTTVLFDVPATFTTGTVRIAPGANTIFSDPTQGYVGQPWLTPPPVKEVDVDLVDRATQDG